MPKKTRRKLNAKVPTAAMHGSPSGELRDMLELMVFMNRRDEAERKLDDGAWKLLGSLTRHPKTFPKAALLGTVLTDIAELTIDGGSSQPIKIRTGSDGDYAVYADNYQDGFPGRIIIEIAHPVKKENEKADRSGGQ